MTITISPLDLLLDEENPRFVILDNHSQDDIRKYLVTYEDVCSLSSSINEYGSLLPGERIVVLKRDEKYIAIEGNRRTCSLQLLLDPTLIPNGFQHHIPVASKELKQNCAQIEVDVVPNRDVALGLMSKRHIEGVRQWKPFAKKQFFAANYSTGQTVKNLSQITGIKESDIKADIRDYKFFLESYNNYCSVHPNYDGKIIDLKIDPFLRIFKAKVTIEGKKIKPTDMLKMSYTEHHDTVSALPKNVFYSIVQQIFEGTTITNQLNTRNTLIDVEGVIELLKNEKNQGDEPSHEDKNKDIKQEEFTSEESDEPTFTRSSEKSSSDKSGRSVPPQSKSSSEENRTGGPKPGGPKPQMFFENLSWEGKLFPDVSEHQGLLTAVNELHQLSKVTYNKRQAYEIFPISTGMILRTAYEQVLRLRLRELNLWGEFMKTVNPNAFPTLKGMENYIMSNINTIFPTSTLKSAMNTIIAYNHRDFLNANIHSPGNIRVTPDALEGIAQAGMFTLIQELINLL